MFFCVDIGNTDTVIGLAGTSGIEKIWRISTNSRSTHNELAITLNALLQNKIGEFGLAGARDREQSAAKKPYRSSVCSVVPSLTEAWSRCIKESTGASPLIVSSDLDLGITFDLDVPSEIGADRIVNSFMAIRSFKKDLIIVDFGTATTFDVVDMPGIYRGGAIVPGVEISAEALFNKAAKLARIELTPPPSMIGKNTSDSIRSGLIYGTAAMVDGVIERIESDTGKKYLTVATGGISPLIAPYSDRIKHLDADLTINGLYEISCL